MSYFIRTIQNPGHRKDLFDRLARLDSAQPPLWGGLTAPEMLVHLCDQMRMPYNDNPSPHTGTSATIYASSVFKVPSCSQLLGGILDQLGRGE